ncbi:MAG TPA: archease [Phycisphaerae bacterium]|nr:archease [Phycisphaerae bacterium]
MEPAFELCDHTADLGVRVRADTREELVAPAIDGLYAAIGGLEPAPATEGRTLDFTGDDAAVLLRDLLAELLYLFEHERLIVVGTTVDTFDNAHLRVHVQLGQVPADAAFDREVKAVTYHELSVQPTAGGYEAVYIVDI